MPQPLMTPRPVITTLSASDFMYSALRTLPLVVRVAMPTCTLDCKLLPWREEKAAAFDTPTMHNIAELSFIIIVYVLLTAGTKRNKKPQDVCGFVLLEDTCLEYPLHTLSAG
mmetsp:Transcript_15678/g.45277  ORF Transcript_15678/g.45277 Transcript_15678/m.45277 type:complete len:112 (-) Transcript_15678:11-346(-)